MSLKGLKLWLLVIILIMKLCFSLQAQDISLGDRYEKVLSKNKNFNAIRSNNREHTVSDLELYNFLNVEAYFFKGRTCAIKQSMKHFNESKLSKAKLVMIRDVYKIWFNGVWYEDVILYKVKDAFLAKLDLSECILFNKTFLQECLADSLDTFSRSELIECMPLSYLADSQIMLKRVINIIKKRYSLDQYVDLMDPLRGESIEVYRTLCDLLLSGVLKLDKKFAKELHRTTLMFGVFFLNNEFDISEEFPKLLEKTVEMNASAISFDISFARFGKEKVGKDSLESFFLLYMDVVGIEVLLADTKYTSFIIDFILQANGEYKNKRETIKRNRFFGSPLFLSDTAASGAFGKPSFLERVVFNAEKEPTECLLLIRCAADNEYMIHLKKDKKRWKPKAYIDLTETGERRWEYIGHQFNLKEGYRID